MIYGSFRSIKGVKYKVEIGTTYDYEIGSSDDIQFSEDPIEITQEVDDTFQHIIKTSCTISLITKIYLGDYLFTANDRDISVNIYKITTDSSDCVFSGFVEPQSYNQDFAETYVEISIQCYDFLSTLENHKWREETLYEALKSSSGTVKFLDMIKYTLGGSVNTSSGIDTYNWNTSYDYLYDKSIKVEGYGNYTTVFSIAGISELLLLGDEEDDLWTCEEVLTQVLQYLNLHIMQKGKTFYIFNWYYIKSNNTTLGFYDIRNNKDSDIERGSTVTVDKTFYSSNDTQISMSEVYNKILIECDLQDIENVFTSPLDTDTIKSPYTNKNRYCYCVWNDGDEQKSSYFYNQVKVNDGWTFRYYDSSTGTVRTVDSIIDTDSSGKCINQYKIPQTIYNNAPACCLMAISGIEDAITSGDTSVKNNNSMENNLIITINGSGSNDPSIAQSRINTWNTVFDKITNAGGMVEYKSRVSAGALSPNDPNITNYIVFSGTIKMQPPLSRRVSHGYIGFPYISEPERVHVYWESGSGYIYSQGSGTNYIGHNISEYTSDPGVRNINTSGDVGYIFSKQTYPTTSDTGWDYSMNSILPYMDTDSFRSKYGEYYGDWMNFRSKSGYDDCDKVGILLCQLKVGNKYAVEVTENNFEWLTQGQCTSRGLQPTFTLGFNPAVGDYFLMKEWDISNTMTSESNVDAEGTGIPIKNTDNLAGPIEFRILQPTYPTWYQQIRKHPTWFRSTKWWNTELPFMEFVGNIYISEFECKFYSDNGQFNNTVEKDLIYVSDVQNNSIQTKDGITFSFCTALDASESNSKGISTNTKLSSVLNVPSNTNVEKIRNQYNGECGKAEEMYINDYYPEYSVPKVIVDTSFYEDKFGLFKKYKYSYLTGKEFFVTGYVYTPKSDSVQIKMKQV